MDMILQTHQMLHPFHMEIWLIHKLLNADIDNVGLKFYNGRPTIKSKVKLASEQASGIMIWELGQDSFSEYSLLKTIHNEYKNLGFATTELCLD